MTSDAGSRHAPDVQAELHKRMHADEGASEEKMTDAQQKELAWLCSIIGCAVPGMTLAAAAEVGARSPPPTLPSPSLLRVHLHDGRVYSGRLQCIDSPCNLLLVHCSLEAGEMDGMAVGGFAQGQVLLAWRLVKRVEALKETK